LPGRMEWLFSRVFVTPRLHGIHHSNRADEMASNWSSGLTCWDVLHGTLRSDVREEALTIGTDGISEPDQVTLPRLLVMPFARAQADVLRAEAGSA
jgi:sterol desaturase/sphingolipid hydroxylase (fatty acid hydroxylase superfamily)